MNKFGLIIEETTAGSNFQFISSHLDRTTPEIKETLTDERTLAAQLANLSDVYSVQITKNFKVYSLIVTNLTDFLGRAGYYAIRLYAPKNVNLTNFENILASVKEKYGNYTKSNTLNSQNYDDILSSILVIENERKNFIALKSQVNSFYYFDEYNPALSTVFNAKGTNLVNKLYAFNRNKAVPENVALNAGLKLFSTINTSQKEINVINNHGILKDLKINDQLVDFNPNLSDFLLLCMVNDSVTYNTSDDKTFKVVTNTFVSIDKKYISKPKAKENTSHKRKNKSFIEEYGMYLILFLMVGLISGGWFFFLRKDTISNDNVNQQINGDSNQSASETSNTVDSTMLSFEIDDSTKDSVFKTNYEKLKDFRFRFYKGWQFQKIDPNGSIDNKKWKPIEKETLNNAFKLKGEQERNDFTNKLGSISKHELKFDQVESNSRSGLDNENKVKADKVKADKAKADKVKADKAKVKTTKETKTNQSDKEAMKNKV